MGKTLREYATTNSKQEQPEEDKQTMHNIVLDISQQKREAEEVEHLKENISAAFDRGIDPQLILYNAVKAVGLCTHDDTWTESCLEHLNKIYGDLRQESLIVDNAAIASKRLQKQADDFAQKTRTQLDRKYTACQKLLQQIADAMDTLDNIDDTVGGIPMTGWNTEE